MTVSKGRPQNDPVHSQRDVGMRLLPLPYKLFKCLHLLLLVFKVGDGPEGTYTDHRATGSQWHGEDVFLDLRRQAEVVHHLGYVGRGDAFSTGNLAS